MKLPYEPYPDREPADVPTRTPNIQARPEMFGLAVGQGLQNLGKGFESFADSLEKIQQMESDLKVDDAITKNDTMSSERTEDFLSKPGNEAKDGLADHRQGLIDDRDSLTAGMSNYEKRRYLAATRGNLNRDINRSTSHAVSSYKTWQTQEAEGNIRKKVDDTFKKVDSGDDEGVEEGLKEVARMEGQKAAAGKVPPSMIEAQTKDRMGQHMDRILNGTLLKNNPDRAEALLEKFKDAIPASKVIVWKEKIEAKRVEMRGQNKGVDSGNRAVPRGGITPAPLPAIKVAPLGTSTDERQRSQEPGKPPGTPVPETGAKSTPEKRSEAEPPPASSGQQVIQAALHAYSMRVDERALAFDEEYGEPMAKTSGFWEMRAASSRINTAQLSPEFSGRAQAAIAAAEKATGERATINDAHRDPARQAQYYANYTGRPVRWEGVVYQPHGRGGLAAPPGRSRHQTGEAVDLKKGAVLDKLWEWHRQGLLRSKFGVEFLPGRAGMVDRVHLQLARGVAPTLMASRQ